MRRSGVVVGLLAVLTACGQDGGAVGDADHLCTLMGGGNIVGVQVEAGVAPIDGLVLRLCVEERCRTVRPDLMEGSDTVDDGCSGGACSAHAVDNGTQFGYLDIPLTAAPLTVSGHYVRHGRRVTLHSKSIPTKASYPNGSDCGMDGYQTQVTVGASGLG